MTVRQCKTCDFFSAMHSQCRVDAPKAMVVPAEGGAQMIGAFPPMSADGWCGRYEPDDTQPQPSGTRGDLRPAS
jgi:hypothetical protein